jgi:hypothetical protein
VTASCAAESGFSASTGWYPLSVKRATTRAGAEAVPRGSTRRFSVVVAVPSMPARCVRSRWYDLPRSPSITPSWPAWSSTRYGASSPRQTRWKCTTASTRFVRRANRGCRSGRWAARRPGRGSLTAKLTAPLWWVHLGVRLASTRPSLEETGVANVCGTDGGDGGPAFAPWRPPCLSDPRAGHGRRVRQCEGGSGR